MEALYIIVHEHFVDYWIEKGNPQAKGVKQEIERIKREESWLAVTGEPDELHPGMPGPRTDLEVRVCGAFTSPDFMCVDKQILALRLADYNVRMHYLGTLRDTVDPIFREDIL